MLTEEEVNKLLIETLDMDDVQVIQYIFAEGYKQSVEDMLNGHLII